MTASCVEPDPRSSTTGRSRCWQRLSAAAACVVVLFMTASAGLCADFQEKLDRVDHALRNNPSHASEMAVQSCLKRRNFAARLYDSGQRARADRSLEYCFDVLNLSAAAPVATEPAKPSMQELQARAAVEIEQAQKLTPDLDNGLEIFRTCALCHEPEGWGMISGAVPQLAGQHRSVVIKQLADFRAGNRDSVLMIPYASVEVIGSVQALADVAGYIDTLEISVANGKGPGRDLELGERLYLENCQRCHGDKGEGNEKEFIPRIGSQHYKYLLRQFQWIRDGKRRNANAEMVEQIQGIKEGKMNAVLDYISRLEPPPELQAPAGWKNPDFVVRGDD
jgi:cytochrome c553